jgi:CRP-like cAMP-binding protein
MKKLIELLDSVYPLPAALREKLPSIVKVTDIKKRKILLRPGQVCDRMYFIEWGLLRGSKIVEGKELNLWFMKEQDLMTSITSYYKEIESAEYIYAMEDSRLLSITKSQLDEINRTFLEFNFIVRVLTEKYYVLGVEREEMLRVKDGLHRYKYFQKLYPGLKDRIAAKYIASFLGITMESLSRIKNGK